MGTSPNRRMIRIEVSHEAFADLEVRAADAGLPLATYCRGVLTGNTAANPSRHRDKVTPAEWQHLLDWVRAKPSRLDGYTGPRKSLSLAARAQMFNWALDNGMTDLDTVP